MKKTGADPGSTAAARVSRLVGHFLLPEGEQAVNQVRYRADSQQNGVRQEVIDATVYQVRVKVLAEAAMQHRDQHPLDDRLAPLLPVVKDKDIVEHKTQGGDNRPIGFVCPIRRQVVVGDLKVK